MPEPLLDQQEQLRTITDISRAATGLQIDLISLVNRVAQESQGFENPEVELGEISFWYKALVHEFLAFAHGLGHTLRSELSSSKEGLQRQGLGKKDLELLVDVETHKSLTVVLPRTLRMLPRLFAVDFSLDTGGANYRALKALVDARAKFTHPKQPGDIHPLQTLVVMQSAIEWFLRSWKDLLVACTSKFWQPAPEDYSKEHFPFNDSQLENARQMDAEKTAVWNQLDFVQALRVQFDFLTADTKRAFDIALDSANDKVHLSRALVFRNLIRFLFSEIEGMTFIAAHSLYKHRFSGPGPDKRLMVGEHDVVFERVTTVLRDFSKNFGVGVATIPSAEIQVAFGESREVRNRITHPCCPPDLKVSKVEMKPVFKLLDWWHGGAMDCFSITDDLGRLGGLMNRQEADLRDID